MSKITGEGFEVRYEAETHTVVFQGALRLSGMEDYAPILELMRESNGQPGEPVTLDLRELEFLNSSGITMFSRFIIESRDQTHSRLRVVGSLNVPWHGRSLKNLQRLSPALRIELL